MEMMLIWNINEQYQWHYPIYDGSFTGKLISGMGLFAKALKERGIKVIDVEEVESFNLLDCPQLQSI